MSINQAVRYPANTIGPTADYPLGSARNSTVPGAKDGYPYDKDQINDILGYQQALLTRGNITVSGNPDTALESQYLQGAMQIHGLDLASKTAMIADTSLLEGMTLRLRDYEVGNNAGSLFFTIVAAGTGTADDGSFIDLPNTSPPTQAKQNFPSIISIKMFGGVGNGVTSNATPVDNAITYLKPKGGRLHFPAGDYLDANIDVPDSVNNNPIIVFGDGRVTTILRDSSVSGTFIRFRPDSCQLMHLSVVGNNTPGDTANGIMMEDTASSGPKFTGLWDVQVRDFIGGSGVINNGFANAAVGLFITNCFDNWEERGSGGHTSISNFFFDNALNRCFDFTGALVHMDLNGGNIESSPIGFFSGAASAGVGNVVFHSVHFEGNGKDIRLGNGTHDAMIIGGRMSGQGSIAGPSITMAGDATNITRLHIIGPEFINESAGGSHDGSSGVAILVVSGADWVIDSLVDGKVSNITDGSFGTIISNTANTVTATLSGGTDDDWDTGDLYTITDVESINAGANVHVIMDTLEGDIQGLGTDNITLGADAVVVMPGVFSKVQAPITHTSGGALIIDWALGSYVQVNLESDITNLSSINMVGQKEYTLRFKQDLTGGWTVVRAVSFSADGGLTVNASADDSTMTRWTGISNSIVELVKG